MKLATLILAAGRGSRMKSDLPKAIHRVCGKPMVQFLIDRSKDAGSQRSYVIVGHGVEKVKEALDARVGIILQKEQLGSGHAVNQAAKALAGFGGSILVLYCDTPLISTDSLKKLIQNHKDQKTDCTLLSVDSPDPTGYGRVIRNGQGRVHRIVEENNASLEEKQVKEINVGCYIFKSKALFAALKAVKRDPVKKEYYLTDVIEILSASGCVESVKTSDQDEVLGVNTRVDLARITEILQKRILEEHMLAGVGIRDPKTTIVDSGVKIGQDTQLLPHTVIEEGAVIGRGCVIGPFARIRGGSQIGDLAIVGNFVEVVRSQIGKATQIKHLSYLGDAVVGEHVNIGAGTITANFDGKNKHKTVLHDHAQVGSGTVFVAPVTMGKGAKTGAGAVVTKGTRIKDKSVYAGVPAKELLRKTDKKR